MDAAAVHPATPIRSVADRLERLATRSTAGDWRPAGLLASRPEVVALSADGSTEHVAEARAASAGWITAISPAVAAPLAALLRAAADLDVSRAPAVTAAAADLARTLDERLPSADEQARPTS